MSHNGSILRFEDVTFKYSAVHTILDEVNFSIRRGAKITLMGQNGAGKSSLFKMILGELELTDGDIHIAHKAKIAIARQIIPHEQWEMTLREYFQSQFEETVYNIDPRIDEVLEIVNLKANKEKHIYDFSGGQQARILLASALIQNPDILLLDEPTNNLDTDGIEHLTEFLKNYNKTVIVISHDAEFLNAFSTGVLYLDVRTQKMEQYTGNYHDVVEQIGARVIKEKSKNARLEKSIQDKKDKANYFAKKGGRLRALAKQMREDVADFEDNKVDVRKEDKTIRNFIIPHQKEITGDLMTISSYTRMNAKGKEERRETDIHIRKNHHLRIIGPNGIGKTTLLEKMAKDNDEGVSTHSEVRIGYYRQDFRGLDFEKTVYQELASVMPIVDEQKLRSVAAGFLITSELINNKIGTLSEGQKGLVAFAQLVLLEPGLLVLDEPTNHINFRHLPVIAQALHDYEGGMIVISHDEEFMEDIRIDEIFDLGKQK
ncbi:MAG: ATP-binding cassette domain-containing protein [Candidatus Pacebacteria bacterium]|nr:ATP-binding cassette domain-containing protein [Candidatus Paceibacterota bacterium]